MLVGDELIPKARLNKQNADRSSHGVDGAHH
jgi:hypothetical protein